MHDSGPVHGLPGWLQTAGPAGGDERPAHGESLLSSPPFFFFFLPMEAEAENLFGFNQPADSRVWLCRVGREARECFSTGATLKRPFPF